MITGNKTTAAKILTSWDFVVEPPIGIEPMTYALREARHTAPRELSAQTAARARPECSQRPGCAGLPVHGPVHGVAQPAVTECYWMS